MDEFPGNSQTAKPADDDSVGPKNIKKVVAGGVVRRKKPLGKRFTETFFGGDTKGVMNYIMLEVVLPAVKDTVTEVVSQGIERVLYGEGRSGGRRPSSRSNRSGGYTNYSRYSSPSRSTPPWQSEREESRPVSRRARSSHDFDEIILDSRGEAEEVIDNLLEIISKYEAATVADLYELVGVSGNYTDDKWGWTDLRGTKALRVRGGKYLLDIPKPEPLD